MKTTSEIELVSIDKLVPYVNNARTHSAKQINKLRASLREFGFINPILIDRNFNVIAGHGRIEAARKEGVKKLPCVYVDFLTEAQRKAYILADNRMALDADWDEEALRTELEALKFDGFDISFTGFEESDFEDLFKDVPNLYGDDFNQASLAETFIVPPFSVLDSRSSNWTKRKQVWNRLLQSGEGRKDDLLGWSDTIAKKFPNMAGTSIFDPVLCETLYHWFCPPNGKIIDPFAGGSVRGMIASFLERDYTGVDISKVQIEANEKCFSKLQKMTTLKGNELKEPNWICADAKDILSVAHDNAPYNFLISCPPYYDLEQYSDNENDLSNLSWSEFQTAYRQIFKDAIRMLNNDSFAAVVIGEVRNKKNKNGRYLNLVGETITALTEAGTEYYNEMILVTSFASAALRARRHFVPSRKVVKVHQNVLVFVKGDAKKAASKMSNDVDWFKDVEEDEDNS